MLKKQSVILLFLLALSMIVTFQNCGTTMSDGGLFGSQCYSEVCGANPDNLEVTLDPTILTQGIFKISSNPSSGFNNLRLTGTCHNGGYTRTLVKAKLYQCLPGTSNCSILKTIKSTPCGADGKYAIESTTPNLTPGAHKLHIEIVGFDSYYQEVYGRNSKLAPIDSIAQATIRPPVLSTLTGTSNFWADANKLYYFSSSSEKVSLSGYITGFCDYKDGGDNNIYARLAFRNSNNFKLIAPGAIVCTPITAGSAIANSPYRDGRTGYFTLDALDIFMTYTTSLVDCEPSDTNCRNNSLNAKTNRIVSLGFFQKDTSFNYDVYSTRNLILHFTSVQYGKGWLIEPLTEVLRRLKKTFNFTGSNVLGTLDGTSTNNDYTMAHTLLTSYNTLTDPLTSGDRYGYGTRNFIVNKILGALEDISQSIYPGQPNDLYFLGTSTTVPYKNMAAINPNGVLLCGLNAAEQDPIRGVVGATYTTDAGFERIALCLAFRYLNGLMDRNYEQSKQIVEKGVTFINNNAACHYNNEPSNTLPAGDCSLILDLLGRASKIKTRRMPLSTFSNATDDQIKYFGNAMTQYFINKIMNSLAYRNGSGENEIFENVFQTVYPEITDATLRKSLYPNEYNFVGSTFRFGGSRSQQFPSGSAKEAN